MKLDQRLWLLALASILFVALEAKTLDPYKILGVERTATQREIQKAFHKLSLKYHPDKNKNKGAQEKFAEINNAYDILSDEEKRKNYDLYGDEKGQPGFDPGSAGNQGGGYSYFTNGGPGRNGGYGSRPDEWQNMDGQGNSRSFSFSFGEPGGSSFGFGLNDIFSNFFGGNKDGGSQSGSFSSSSRSQHGSRSSPESIRPINSKVYKQEVKDKGITWLFLFHGPSMRKHDYESHVGEVARKLEGALKVGSIDCGAESSLCKELGVYLNRSPKVYVYSYRTRDDASLVEYNGDLTVKDLKIFCQEHLPKFSKRIDLNRFDPSSSSSEKLPKLLLLSTKKDTPIIWRVLSGLYQKRFIFYDAEIRDVSDPMLRKLGVDTLPAIVGWQSNGEMQVLRTGISVKDIKSAVQDLSALLDGFEKKNKKAGYSSQSKKPEFEQSDERVKVLTGNNFDDVCGENIPVCIIGAFRSSRGREKLESVISSVSQKSFLRRHKTAYNVKDPVSYGLVDASKYPAFLNSLEKSGFRSQDKILIAYKPKRRKFVSFTGDLTTEAVERFVAEVLNGDVVFTKTRQRPEFK
ncbi:dnaJ protein ERDJ3A [Impatiens glandulifera]|uniref:dnaJ protein ERDJ3A n=1 Tax=Impatiens glandulifera TaxID=253017 RepID=UPI001FB1010C|nr:dnaJ protein ERDJ3A [Impatiens glandulifera]